MLLLQLAAFVVMIVGAIAVARPLPALRLADRSHALAVAVGGAFVLVLAMMFEGLV